MNESAPWGLATLWRAPLDVEPGALARLEATLSAAERARADALRGGLLRRRYVADHGWRRRLLAQLLGCDAGDVAFVTGEHGKPRLAGSPLGFSASRSGGTALYMTCAGAEVGVDLEEVRPDVDVVAMARRFLSATERNALEALAADRRTAAVFTCWTRKEAYAKARGTGLVFPLTEVEVWAGDDRPVRHGEVEVRGVPVAPGLAAAAALVVDSAAPPDERDGELSQLNVRSIEQLLSSG